MIGYANEYRAEREVQALHRLVRTRARARRSRRVLDVDGERLVPGDLLLLESGARVAADVRLTETHGLRLDESLLTGESLPVDKQAASVLAVDAPLAERRNMAFAGSMVASGRGIGLVVATGLRTEVGAVAGELAAIRREPSPLLRRMERFARVIGAGTIAVAVAVVGIGLGSHTLNRPTRLPSRCCSSRPRSPLGTYHRERWVPVRAPRCLVPMNLVELEAPGDHRPEARQRGLGIPEDRVAGRHPAPRLRGVCRHANHAPVVVPFPGSRSHRGTLAVLRSVRGSRFVRSA